jgi:hypothetical protein
MATCLQTVPVYGYSQATIAGWTGGGRSRASFPGDCFFGWTVPRSAVGVIAGLNTRSDQSTDFLEIEHGFWFQRGSYRIVETGALQTSFVPYAAGDRFYIVRTGNVVYYCLRPADAAPTDFYAYPGATYTFPGEVVYVSRRLSAGSAFLDASFYQIGDLITDEVAGEIWVNSEDSCAALPDQFSATGVGTFTLTGAASMRPDADPVLGGVLSGSFTIAAGAGGDAATGGETSTGGISTPQGGGGDIPFLLTATTSDADDPVFGATSALGRGELTFALDAGSGFFTALSGVAGYLQIDLTGSTYGGAAGVAGELPIIGFATGAPEVDNGAVPAVGAGELSIELVATSSSSDADIDPQPLVPGSIGGELTVEGFGLGTVSGDLGATDAAMVGGELRIEGAAGDGPYFTPVDPPDGVDGIGGLNGELSLIGFGTASEFRTEGTIPSIGSGELDLQGFGFATSAETNALSVVLYFSEDGEGGGENGGGNGGGPMPTETAEVQETASVGDSVEWAYRVNITENAAFLSTPQTYYNPQAEVSEEVRASEALQVALVVRLSDAVEAADAQELVQAAIVLDRALLAATYETAYQAIVQVLESIAALDSAVPAYARSVLDTIEAADSLEVALRFASMVTDAIEVSDSLQVGLTIFVEETAEFQVADSVELTAQLFANILETVSVYALLNTPAELAQGWVMNTEGARPVSEYSNYAFNSLAFTGDEMIGAADDGLYLLEGDDDEGDPIQAQLKTLMLDFGTSRQKRVRSAYMGYTSAGEIVLKVICAVDGELQENWYKGRKTSSQDVPGENYIEIGQGLKSRYWQFELENIDGADFEIDVLELHPVLLSRRV